MELEFKQIEDFPGYWITNTGEVFSENFNKTGLGGFLNLNMSRDYYMVRLYNKTFKRGKQLKIHRLVLEAFKPHKGKKLHVDHIDADKLNNNLSNLRWVTASENSKHIWNTVRKRGSIKHDQKYNKWRVSIKVNNQFKHLGSFDSEGEAQEALQCYIGSELTN